MPSVFQAIPSWFRNSQPLKVFVGLAAFSQVMGQEPAPPADSLNDGKLTHESSQKVEFKSIPAIAVLFSTYPTRVSEFEQFCKDTGRLWDHKPNFPQTGDHPVVNVTLDEAIAYCEWLTEKDRKGGVITDLQSYRLPTNKEWDSAVGLLKARQQVISTTQEVEDQRSFPWGIEWPPPDRAGNFNSQEISGEDDGYAYTSPVGLFTPSKEGLYDLAGNVWEWAWDQGDRASASASATLRGGSWMYFRKESLLSAYRYQVPTGLRAPSVGFRVVFEDKQRVAALLAAQQQTDNAQAAERRGMIPTAPGVSSEEVEKMRAAMARGESAPKTGPSALPDPSTLTPAKADAVFTNTLGMKLHPVEGVTVLFGENEVRVEDYQRSGKSWDRKPTFEIKDNHPIVNISWQEAKDFCAWLTEKDRAAGLIDAKASYRLPTDAEWSTAVGLKDEVGNNPQEKHEVNQTDYPWGRDATPPSASANLDTNRMTGYQDNFPYTAPVGSFSPNNNRLFDLAGNAAEWCEDIWPGNAEERVIRGSSWLSSSNTTLLSSHRQHMPASAARPNIGFRIVLDFAANP